MTEFETLCNEYRENKRLQEELDAENETIKARILEIMDGREVVTMGAAKASYKAVNGSRLDATRLKAERPEISAAYTVATSYKRFIVS